MNWNTEKLQSLGFRPIASTRLGRLFARLRIRKMTDGESVSEWAVGELVIVHPRYATRLQAAVDMQECKIEALGQLAQDPRLVAQIQQARVGGFLDVLKKFGRKFKNSVNRVAKTIAKAKIMNRLRQAYIAVIQSPIADLGVKAGAKALSLFGVPPQVTELAINQRRAAVADRMAHGGWAGMIERATGKEGLAGVAREVAQRNIDAAKKAAGQAIPELAQMVDHKMAKSLVSGDWSWMSHAR
jgi:hypothetical protein